MMEKIQQPQACIKSVRDIPFGIPFQISIPATPTVASYSSCLFIVQPCDITEQHTVVPVHIFVSDDEVEFVDDATNLSLLNHLTPAIELNFLAEDIQLTQAVEDSGQPLAAEDNEFVVKTEDDSVCKKHAYAMDSSSINSANNVFANLKVSNRARKPSIKRLYLETEPRGNVDCLLNEAVTRTWKDEGGNLSNIKAKSKRQRLNGTGPISAVVKATERTNKGIDDEHLLYSQCVKTEVTSDNTRLYTCQICEFNSDCKDKMSVHINMHLSLKCAHCGFIAINEMVYQHHVNELYCKSLGYVCKECGDASSSFVKLKCHLGSVHNKPVFTCKFCLDGFSNEVSLKKHVGDTHTDTMLSCDQRGAAFQLEQNLEIHKKTCKGPGGTGDVPRLDSISATPDTHSQTTKTIVVCQMQLPRKQVQLEEYPDSYRIETVTSLSQMDRRKSDNEKKTTLYACKLCNRFRVGDKRAIETHLEMHTNGDFKCKSCDFEASSIPELRKHTKQHLQSGCVCDICGVVMANQDKLKQHLGYVHNMAVFVCEHCSTTENPVMFRSRPQLRDHCLQNHGDKAIQCTQCGGSFFGQLSIRAHKFQCRGPPKHTQYQCPQCESNFKMANALKRHIRYAHKMERNYKCDMCTFVTFKRETLSNHVKTHLRIHDFRCDECKFTCVKRDQLKSHMKTHTGERPFKCDQCPYTSAANVQLKAHRSVHNMTDTVHCPLCGVVVRDCRAYSRHCGREHKGSNIIII